jgi:hypothetical protein
MQPAFLYTTSIRSGIGTCYHETGPIWGLTNCHCLWLDCHSSGGHRIALVFKCNVLVPGFVDNGQASTPVNCPGTNLPYTVPVDWNFCISTMYLMTKYPWNPPQYDDSLHSTYLEIPGMSVAAHHPEVHFVPSLPYKTSAPA